ncbi:alpha/beta hydrolase family protein [Streptomyces olivoreticuli]|uniref:alpha/beta hydrolase family protein n=1 Tax=Streptomyces olivoreticuli TaxID=68246 RepID=UPI001968061C|nr:prolyl oligopeptidase family serine peptidase [Streptomyces olivoreticuli]
MLVHGSGPGPREEYMPEAEAFARAGIAALVYDKRTVGYSHLHRDFPLLADDARAAMETLRARGDVDPAEVGLWGFSEGGWVAPLAATKAPGTAFLITVGGPGVTPLRAQTWNLGNQLRHGHVSGSIRDAVTVPAAHLLSGAGLFPAADYDPVPVLEHVRPPVLALWGEYDTQVPPRESAQVFRQTLARAGNRHVTIRFVPGAGHNGHRTKDGFEKLGGPVVDGKRLGALGPGYADVMTSWVQAVAAGQPPVSSAASPPRQEFTSRAATTGVWYESISLQYAVLALFLVAFAGYPVIAGVRRITGHRGRPAASRPALWLAATGAAAVAGTLTFMTSVFALGGKSVTPFVLGRPLPWIVLQALALAVVVATAATGLSWWRARHEVNGTIRIRLALLLTAGTVFVPWALYWRLLLP